MKKIVVVSGKFDPIHEGHIEHIIQAAKLGEYIIVITHKDEIIAKNSKKKFCAVPLKYRMMLIDGILMYNRIRGKIIVSIDENGTSVKTLEQIHKSYPLEKINIIYAKGGDRIPENMLKDEVDMCRKLGIEIRYGVGELLNSSSKMLKY